MGLEKSWKQRPFHVVNLQFEMGSCGAASKGGLFPAHEIIIQLVY